MSDTRRRQVNQAVGIMAAVHLLITTSSVHAESPLLFVESFNQLLKEGKVKVDVDYRVEGRITSIAPDLLKLQKCSLVFRPAQGESFGKTPDKRHVVEVFGRLRSQGSKRVFVVSNLRFVYDDGLMYGQKKNGVRANKAADWYKLASWAHVRAEFYDDDSLRQRTIEARRSGIAVERKQLVTVNPTTLLALADKAADLKLPAADYLEFVHEAYRLTWDELQQEKRPNVDGLVANVKRQLPGATDRLPTPQPDLEEKYRKNPLSVYRKADTKSRRKLHRLFYREVKLVSIRDTAMKEGKNGFDIADQIDEELPEQHDLAEQHRDRELNERVKRIDRLTRSEMLDLADRFRRRREPAAADDVVKKWLKAVESQLRLEGPAGLMRVAEEYIDLVEDRKRAVELLKEAYQLSPDSNRIAERLTQLEYRLQNGEWVPAAQVKNRPLDPIQRAIREGRVIAGMTAAQVRSTLGAATSVTRIASAGQISELWIYGEANATRITVHLLRRTPRSQLMAIRVAQVSPESGSRQ